jgi:hypothetical protein
MACCLQIALNRGSFGLHIRPPKAVGDKRLDRGLTADVNDNLVTCASVSPSSKPNLPASFSRIPSTPMTGLWEHSPQIS